MCIINDLIRLPCLLQEDVWQGVLDPLHADCIWFIRNVFESWDVGIKIGEQAGELLAKKGVELLASPVELEDQSRIVGLNSKPCGAPRLQYR